MTILCPKEFHEAVQFAANADQMVEAAIRIAQKNDSADLPKLLEKRGQATRTLLGCFGYRANADAVDNENPYFPDGSEVHFDQSGKVRTILDMKPKLPVRETFIYKDWAPYSFFFSEEWLEPYTRCQVDIFDRCWYIFRDGRAQSVVDGFDESELDDLIPNNEGVRRTYNCEEAKKAVTEGVAVREVMRRRKGMCGGIIYHADYGPDGKRLDYGIWSTHT